MDNEELFQFEDRTYVRPEVSRDEQLDFVDKFRALQGQSQAQINRDTYNLGTQVPSALGGLTGAENLWTAQYRTPQVNAAVENLKQAAQLSALNTALANQQNMWQNRYNQAERAYNRAKMKRDYTPTTTGGNNSGVNFEGQDSYDVTGSITGGVPHTQTILGANGRQEVWEIDENGNRKAFLGYLDPETGKVTQEGNSASVHNVTNNYTQSDQKDDLYNILSVGTLASLIPAGGVTGLLGIPGLVTLLANKDMRERLFNQFGIGK